MAPACVLASCFRAWNSFAIAHRRQLCIFKEYTHALISSQCYGFVEIVLVRFRKGYIFKVLFRGHIYIASGVPVSSGNAETMMRHCRLNTSRKMYICMPVIIVVILLTYVTRVNNIQFLDIIVDINMVGWWNYHKWVETPTHIYITGNVKAVPCRRPAMSWSCCAPTTSKTLLKHPRTMICVPLFLVLI